MAKCTECGTRLPLIGSSGLLCGNCDNDRKANETAARPEKSIEPLIAEDLASAAETQALASIIITTETTGLPVAERLGVIGAECVAGFSFLKDISASFRDIVGGRSATLQRELRQGRETVLKELKLTALDMGANGLVGISIHYSEIGGTGARMVLIAATGTAVRLA